MFHASAVLLLTAVLCTAPLCVDAQTRAERDAANERQQVQVECMLRPYVCPQGPEAITMAEIQARAQQELSRTPAQEHAWQSDRRFDSERFRQRHGFSPIETRTDCYFGKRHSYCISTSY